MLCSTVYCKTYLNNVFSARFVGNPHVVAAGKADYSVHAISAKPTFPEPLPAFLPRTVKLAATSPTIYDPASANAGRFSKSLKGIRKDMRKAGYKAEFLVGQIEREVLEWLHNDRPHVTMLGKEGYTDVPRRYVGDTESVQEVERTPAQLVWSIPGDVFARYVVHSLARYHEIVSFSTLSLSGSHTRLANDSPGKDIDGERLTILLRPNITRPGAHSRLVMDTPPVTDLDNSSHFDSESDFVSDQDALSAIDESDVQSVNDNRDNIPTIPESPSLVSVSDYEEEDSWSVIGGTDIEADESASEAMDGLAGSIDSLTLDPNTTLTDAVPPQILVHARDWRRQQLVRSSSSPSRSPSRRPGRRTRTRPPLRAIPSQRPTFYEFLYC